MATLRRLLDRTRQRTQARRPGRASALVVVDDDNAPVTADCLGALAAQRRPPGEVLLVNIGALAATATAVAQAVESSALDVGQVSAPPSSTKAEALQRALRRATGEYVLLLDGGDVLTPAALEALAGSLDRSGAALATAGPVEASRTTLAATPDAVARPELATTLVRREGVQIRLAEEPLLDWLPAVRLLLDAPCFDVVAEDVRARPRQGTGAAFGTMPARAAAVPAWSTAVEELLTDPRSAPARAQLARRLLSASVPEYLDDAERCTDETWRRLCDTVRSLYTAGTEVLADLPAQVRAYAWLATQGRRADVVELGVRRWTAAGAHPTRVDAGRVHAVLAVEGVPGDVLVMHETETGLVCRPWRLGPGPGQQVVVDVRAFIRGVGNQHGTAAAALTLVAPDGERHGLDVEVHPDPDVNRWAQEPHQDHTHACLVGRARRPLRSDAVGPGWQLEVRLSVAGVVRSGIAPPPPWGRAGGWRLTRLSLDGARLTVTGAAAQDAATTLRLHGPQGQVVSQWDVASPFTVAVPVRHDAWGLGAAALPPGTYRLTVDDGPLRLDALAAGTTLLRSEACRIAVEVGPRAVRLVLGPPLADDEVGAWSQRRLQRRYALAQPDVDPRVVLLQSYTGQSCTDSPRALHDALRVHRPDLELVWAVADRSTRVPPGGRGVLLRSREWYDVLATAGHLVTNIDLDRWFAKRPGQRLLQTYHGYPSKTMGIAAWEAKNLTPRRIQEQLRRTSATWDLLLTPTPEMDVHYREEYRYDGPIHSFGYPRDDALVAADTERVREEVRRRLGVGDRTAVLYAPTWRDDLATNFRAAAMGAGLDVEALTAALGGQVVVLLRGHRFHRRRGRAGRRVLDVTDYPEINDLILAADAAVLDYSSLRFDFALTGRPMVFLVPDLERYETGVRGFLYDFRSSAPGPLLDTTAQVVDALRDLPALSAGFEAELSRFNAEFNRYHDGHAAERVVAAFLPR